MWNRCNFRYIRLSIKCMCFGCSRLIDWVVVLCPTRLKIGHFGDVSQANLLAWYGKTKLTQQKHTFTNQKKCTTTNRHHHNNRFTALFPGPPGWAVARRELLEFVVQGKINTDHPAGRHSVRTNKFPPPPSTHFLHAGCASCRPTNSVKALNSTSAFGLGRRR